MINRSALVLVTTSFPIKGDGSEAAGSFVGDLAESIAQAIPVRVVAPGVASRHESWAPNVDVFRYAAPDRPLSTLKPWIPADLGEIRSVWRAGARATLDAASHGGTAHLLALWALPSGHWARMVAQRERVGYSVWTLGSDIWTLGRVPIIRSYLRAILRDASACYSDGLQLADDTRRLSGREVEFLPSTRSIKRTRSVPVRSNGPYRLVFIGRWHKNKGVDLLLDSLSLLADKDWQRIEVVEICGGGPLQGIVRNRVESLQAAGRPIVLHGFLDKNMAEEAILQADYLLIPSRVESIPVVFSDAMKLECPVVCMPVGDLPRLVVEGSACGVVADSVSAESFTVALSRALAGNAHELSQATAVRAEQFDLAKAASRLVGRIAGGNDA